MLVYFRRLQLLPPPSGYTAIIWCAQNRWNRFRASSHNALLPVQRPVLLFSAQREAHTSFIARVGHSEHKVRGHGHRRRSRTGAEDYFPAIREAGEVSSRVEKGAHLCLRRASVWRT